MCDLSSINRNYKSGQRNFVILIHTHPITSLYHFTDLSNIPSIKKFGGLFSYQYCNEHGIDIPCPGGNEMSRYFEETKDLMDYIHLSFNPVQPMMFVAKNEGRLVNPVILKIDPEVIYWEETRFSNMNATDSLAVIGDTFDEFQSINLKIATGSMWNGQNEKKLFQAEVLVKKHIPMRYIQFPSNV